MKLRLRRGQRTAVAATILVAMLAIVGPSPAWAGTLSIDPKAGEIGSGVSVTGSGWDPKLGTASILWDGKDVGQGFIDDKGELSGAFKVPADVAGGHEITMCAPDAATCVEQAFGTFVLVVPEPSPSPTSNPTPNPTPTGAPTPAPPPTKVPGENPTPTPANTAGPAATASTSPTQPGIGDALIDLLAPLYRPPAGGWPAIVGRSIGPSGDCSPSGSTFPLYSFDGGPVGNRIWWRNDVGLLEAIGQIDQPLVETASGRLALASVYDDLGSAGRPITIQFARPHHWLTVRVGRDAPIVGGPELTAQLTGYVREPAGWREVARSQLTLPPVPTPIRQCLRLDAPADTPFSLIRLEYLEPDGSSAYERRWLDSLNYDTSVERILPLSPRIVISSPLDGQVLEQPPGAPTRLTLDLYDATDRNRISLTVNGAPVIAPFAPAPDGALGHYQSVVTVTGLPVDVAIPVRAQLVLVPGISGQSQGELARSSDLVQSSFTIRPPVTGNLLVTGIEPIQVTQTPSLGVGLISGKRSAIRVYVQGISDSRGPWRLSSASLTTVDEAGIERLHKPANVSLADGFVAPAAGSDRNRADDSLLFVLAPEETRPGTLRLSASISGPQGRPETNAADNTMNASVGFRQGQPLAVYAFLASYLGREGGTWTDLETFGRTVENLFPVTTLELVPLPVTGHNVISFLNLGDMQAHAERWLTYVPGDLRIFALRPDTRCYGDPPPKTCEGGYSWFRRNDGYRNPIGAAAVMAQELSHSYHLVWHAQTPGEWADGPYAFWNPEWPYYHTGIGHPGIDWVTQPGSASIVPATTAADHVHDYMSYARAGHWTSPFTYCDLGNNLYDTASFCLPGTRTEPSRYRPVGIGQPPFGRTAVGSDATLAVWQEPPVGPDTRAAIGTDREGWRLAVAGTIEPDGRTTIGTSEAVFRPDEGTEDLYGDEYRIELVDAAGAVIASRGFVPAATHPLPDAEPVAWTLLLPRPDGIAKIVVRHLGEVVAERMASSNPPMLTILEPTGDVTWRDGVTTTVRWQTSDADGDPVRVTVLYSTDDGATWWPLVMQSEANDADIDPSTIPGADRARLRLTATDGVNTTVADLAGTVSLADHPPNIRITSPADGTTVRPGQPVVAVAEGDDLEQPLLVDAGVSWSIDAGRAAPGRWATFEGLAAGIHVLTASMTDRAGHTATASVTLKVAGPDWNKEPAPTGEASPTMAPVAIGLAMLVVLAAAGLVLVRRNRRQRHASPETPPPTP